MYNKIYVVKTVRVEGESPAHHIEPTACVCRKRDIADDVMKMEIGAYKEEILSHVIPEAQENVRFEVKEYPELNRVKISPVRPGMYGIDFHSDEYFIAEITEQIILE